MCLYPTLILNPKYKANKKNGGKPPSLTDDRVKYCPIGCQQCIECRKQKARSWQCRLLEDIKDHTNGKFITLTFSNESIKQLLEQKPTKNWPGYDELTGYELDNEIATRAMRLFLERWRKKYGKSLRHWMVTEIGHNGTENIHLHGIIWIADKFTHTSGRGKNKKTEVITAMEEIEKIWSYGFVWKGYEENGQIINYVNGRTVSYITKYIHKVDEEHKSFKSVVLTSPGIGSNYTTKRTDWKKNKFKGKKTIETYRNQQGYKMNMPIYWRNKIYSEEEREKLWLQRLDKNERWVCGERICIKNGEEDYYNILEYYRKQNKWLGYGNGQISWNRKQYEEKRRELRLQQRIQEAKKKEKYIYASGGVNSRILDLIVESTESFTEAGRGGQIQPHSVKIGNSNWIVADEGIKLVI